MLARMLVEDVEFALRLYDYVYDLALKVLPYEDKITLILSYKKSDLILLKEAINEVERQIKIAASMDFHDLIPYLRYKKSRYERELYEMIKERLRFVFSLMLKNYLLKKD